MAAADARTEFADKTCSAPSARSDRMRDIVVAHVPRDRPVRLLDLGSGTGSLVFRLVDALPAAEVTGIDISPANIRVAMTQRATRREGARAHFTVANYFDYSADPFDAIVTDGVLHLIPGDTAALVTKLANDIVPGGLLICSMPFPCLYNSVLTFTRKTLRQLRSPWLDGLIFRMGRLLHSHEMDDAGLRERVVYMYLVPERLMGDQLIGAFSAAGLRRIHEHEMRSTSLSQLRHRVTVFVKGKR